MKLFTIPNFLTLGNLLCGCFGIIAVFYGEPIFAGLFIGIALVCDFLDGFLARLLKSESPIGKELDSLADVVTFGVLPGFILYSYIHSASSYFPDKYPFGLEFIPFVLILFSALRLAKFNVDTRQTQSFIGIPTPANGMIVGALPFIENQKEAYFNFLFEPEFIIVYTLIMSYLLISEIPLFALKFKEFSWKTNKIKYVFLVTCMILIISLKYLSIPLIVILYLLTSIIANLTKTKI
jgi:CDP-diacylglycerol---serine O-phosphatidyltransferase